MSVQNYFPIFPEGMTWENWNGAALHYFSEQPIPYLPELQWREVAKNLTQLPTFENYPVPSPDTYANWQDWAREFNLIVNGPTR